MEMNTAAMIDALAAPAPPGRLRILAFSDYICPWCYIGLARIERLQREFPIDVIWAPYELHPETPPEGTPLAAAPGSRRAAMQALLMQIAADEGIALASPRRLSNSRLALEAAEYARDQSPDTFETLHRALFRAYFVEGRDLGEPETVLALGEAAGLDRAALAKALEERRYAAQVDAWVGWAREHGIGGTPTFLFDGRFALTGAQEYLVFADIARRLLARKAGEDSIAAS
jgi:predicted DsbA family dithiol-disulfide isomerase